MKKITDSQLQKLENFIGYGRKDAKTIFFGLEEAGGGIENLHIRLGIKNYELLDCRDFHLKHLGLNGDYNLHSYDPSNKVKFQPVWRYMSYLKLRIDGKMPNELFKNKSQALREYQNNYLGTLNKEGDTLLTEIYPIPCRNMNSWIDDKNTPKEERIIPQYKSKKEYQETVLPKRQKLFSDLFNSEDFQADTIICYGKSKWDEFKKFFNEFDIDWKELNLDKPTQKGYLNENIQIYLIPFLGNGQVSYKYLDRLVEKITL
ncbi:hypothetical protein GCM10023115_28270 [Pontixanthobacter gangjinensis]|uniref:Uncharacterized protein n=1 Tax=Christiangramia aestuarii TaxID=1028746 RepID=A0A7K1LMM2_9FLAO|nr:hypothetical protein [Christiangramia aestuarii]MUP42059.1 hypothetical protein [Christiangramia aestuarii]